MSDSVQCPLVEILGQNMKANTSEFWNSVDRSLSEKSPLIGRLTAKAKQKLSDIFRHSISSPNPQFTIQIVISLIQRFSQSPVFLENFGHNDSVFYSTFTAFVSRVLNKPSDGPYGKLKTDLLIALDALYREPSVLREETAKGVLITIIPMLKNVNDTQSPVVASVAFIHKLIQNIEGLTAVIAANAALFMAAFEGCQSPRLQMQILRIMWTSQVKTTRFSLVHDEDADFVDTVHQKIAALNDGVGCGILTLSIHGIDFPSGECTGHGWVDFGMTDLVLYYDSKILPIPFECIQGLNMNGADALLIELESGFAGMGPGSSEIRLRFESALSSEQVNLIFARISQGESQPQNFSDATHLNTDVDSDIARDSSVVAVDSFTRRKSSIAVFQIPDAQNTQMDPVSASLFAESQDLSDKEPEEPPPPLIQGIPSSGSSPVIESRPTAPSPPPPTIDQHPEGELEQMRHRQPVQYEPDHDDAILVHSAQIADKISSGIDTLTRTRLDSINRFGQVIGSSVDRLKDDIRTTMRDREHGSVKQLDASKAMFQENIHQFKRKAASMHQTLIGFEQDAQAMSAKITAIQRKVRKEIQQRRIDLENELKKLRKLIRNQHKGDDSDPSDEEPIDGFPLIPT
jgi:hypothetical protein